MYTPQEAATIGHNIDQDKGLNRAQKKLIKERMPGEVMIPIKMTQLSKLIRNHGASDNPKENEFLELEGTRQNH